MHTLKKGTKKNNQSKGCEQVSFPFFFGFLQCINVFVCLSCFSLLYGNSGITIHKSQLEPRLSRYTDQICHKSH